MSEIVTVKVRSWEDSDYATHDTLEVDGKQVFGVHPLYECPEDAIIGRDLISSSDIASFLESFLIEHRGKKVKFVFVEGKEDEEDE
ncbi:hypothetical protein AF332_20755 [Sporosarcina globispora]|uniref:Uncharacterized protein n=1 Tax=Sporosarcina globispora TaxID=1459 RepID=A0A0M0GGU6_SPOGL|nr:hypothetical protein [Sporosarcina globispora]KON88978.1 hypothetical protein AF332_20755 [Sporosarcina globispora]